MTRIALVVLDTLRNDFFERHFDWLPGVRFENAWSPSHWTVPVHASLFTGLYPSEHGVHAKNQILDIETDVLAERLTDEGYMTRAYTANPYLSPSFDFDRGFQEFYGNARVQTLLEDTFDWDSFLSKHQNSSPIRYFKALYGCFASEYDTLPSLKQGFLLKMRGEGWMKPKDSGGRQALRWLDSRSFGRDEFVFVNLMEAHAPYDEIPNDFQTNNSFTPPNELGLQHTYNKPADVDEIRQVYKDAVSYLSKIYKDIFSTLIEEMDYVITIGDHGELLGEHDLWGHEYGLYPELTHVPLVISDGSGKTERRDGLVNLLDIHQTILELTNLSGQSRGKYLLGEHDSKKYLLEGHGLPKNRIEKLTQLSIPVGRYDEQFQGIVAPPSSLGYESSDGWVSHEPDGSDDELQEQLDRLVDNLAERDVQSSPDEIDEQTLQQLRDMGYA
ncbi:sulfatase-like hydrolase/transferase [Halomicrococcus sp. SG-WS-1]|uniref:sulfatase-like hydrolase/transferase n=1 Tax=Halomicrococcus sp. SG-WS-1 TaxID=3439057 RepID=UPI003F78BF3A